MPPESPRVVASIVTWNHAHCIAACLEGLLNQTYRNVHVFVYDNASQDGTREALRRFSPQVHTILADENSGFCGGHNAVISRTKSDLVLLVNPDVVLPPDYVEKAVQAIKSDRSIGTLCGLLLQTDPADPGCLIDGAGLIMSRSRHPILRYHRAPYRGLGLTRTEVFGCDGALPLFRRRMIEDISIERNFFDPMFFAHKEDHDIAWRAQILGWKTVFAPECIAIHPRHFKPGSLRLRRTIAPEIKYHAVKNDLLLLLKNEDLLNFCKDFIFILPRQIAIFAFVLLFERSSLRSYGFVLRKLRAILRQRREIQRRRRVSSAELRRRFCMDLPYAEPAR